MKGKPRYPRAARIIAVVLAACCIQAGCLTTQHQESENKEDLQTARALVDKGVILGRQGEVQAAIDTFDEVVKRFGGDTSPGVREQVASALFNKGNNLGGQGKTQAAIDTYEEVVTRFGGDTAPGVRELVAKAYRVLERFRKD